MQAGPGGAVSQGALRGDWLGGGGGRGGVVEEVEGGLGSVVAAGGGHFVEVPGHLADDGAARAAGLDLAAYQQQPGVEHGVCDVLVGVFEEGDVDQSGAVLQCAEDNALAGRPCSPPGRTSPTPSPRGP
ncbi:hypothetical protein GCM10010339_93810 [Streptomyces alanosinicus]|uniref:Uncharacterized protein n=1 Tax=Streptomyces alanosinicus TaxID=68171 RepID=A0A918IPI2_9ACTN|nr:hypothetical protein GCM10010339_93810 [Streptomyces alanosinicus]